MIEVNLLPHREAKRVADLRESVALFCLGIVLIGGGVFFAENSVEDDMVRAESMVRQLQADIKRYKPQEAKVKKYRKKREELEDKLAVIEGLDKARTGPVRVMDALAESVPERLWITEMETTGGSIKLKGESTDTGVVADFLRSLNESASFTSVDLDRTSSGGTKQGVRVVDFVVTAKMPSPKKKKKSKSKSKGKAKKS